MEVETSINYNPLNGSGAAKLSGDIKFQDAAGTDLAGGSKKINTELDYDAATDDDFLKTAYGIDPGHGITKYKIDADGGLSVLEPADAKTTFYSPLSTAKPVVENKLVTVTNADGTQVQLTPGGPYVPDAGGTPAAPTSDQLLQFMA